MIYISRRKSQRYGMYFPRFVNIWISSETFYSTDVGRRNGYSRILGRLRHIPPEKISKTRILSQFCRGIVQLRTMNNDRLTDFLLFWNFCRGSSCDRDLTTSDTQGLPLSRPIYKKYVDTPSNRDIFYYIHISPLKLRRTFCIWRKTEANMSSDEKNEK